MLSNSKFRIWVDLTQNFSMGFSELYNDMDPTDPTCSNWVQKQPCEDPEAYPQSKFRDAFLAAISEYNQFGVAATSMRFRIDSATSLQLFGFKVAW